MLLPCGNTYLRKLSVQSVQSVFETLTNECEKGSSEEVSALFCAVFNSYQYIFRPFFKKIFFVECNSTLPPHPYYHPDNQQFIYGGIMVELWVELHEVPPIIPPAFHHAYHTINQAHNHPKVEEWNFHRHKIFLANYSRKTMNKC